MMASIGRLEGLTPVDPSSRPIGGRMERTDRMARTGGQPTLEPRDFPESMDSISPVKGTRPIMVSSTRTRLLWVKIQVLHLAVSYLGSLETGSFLKGHGQ